MFIICPIAGVGKYLQSFVVSKPKSMINLAGKPIIDHVLDLLKDYFPKDTEICFIVGYKKRIIMDHIQQHHKDYFKIYFEEQNPIGYNGDIPFFGGIGDAVRLAGKYARGKDSFILFADHYPTESFQPMLDEIKNGAIDGVINVQEVSNPQDYGIVDVDSEGIITKLVEKPLHPLSNLAITWGYLIKKHISNLLFDYLDQEASNISLLGQNLDLTSAFQALRRSGIKLKIHKMTTNLLDFGSLHDFLKGNQFLLEKQIQNEKLSKNVKENSLIYSDHIKDCIIIPPVFIGESCEISNSVIGPNVSIGKKTKLDRCIVSNAVIGEYTTMNRIITDQSLIGDYASLEDLVKQNISIGDSSNLIRSHLEL